MVQGREVVQLGCCPDYFIDPRITEFNNLSGFNINKMIVLTALIGSFKLCNILPELVLDNKIAVEEQFNRIV